MNGNGTQILRLDQYLIDRGRVQADGQGRQSGGGSIGAAWASGGVTYSILDYSSFGLNFGKLVEICDIVLILYIFTTW